jgi:hypothetical protein
MCEKIGITSSPIELYFRLYAGLLLVILLFEAHRAADTRPYLPPPASLFLIWPVIPDS